MVTLRMVVASGRNDKEEMAGTTSSLPLRVCGRIPELGDRKAHHLADESHPVVGSIKFLKQMKIISYTYRIIKVELTI